MKNPRVFTRAIVEVSVMRKQNQEMPDRPSQGSGEPAQTGTPPAGSQGQTATAYTATRDDVDEVHTESAQQARQARLICQPEAWRSVDQKEDEFAWLQPESEEADNGSAFLPAVTGFRELTAVMQYVRANRKLRLHRSAFRVSRAWSEGVWQVDDPHGKRLEATMDCVLSMGERPTAALDRLAEKLITPEFLAAYDCLIEALEGYQSTIYERESAHPYRSRADLKIVFAALELRNQMQNLVGEADLRRVNELMAQIDLAERVIDSPLVARRLGSQLGNGKSDPRFVLQWAHRQDGVPAVNMSSELAKLAAIFTLFDWVGGELNPNPAEVTIPDGVIFAGALLAS
jgi:hypothetical protein